ncbi:hypothetical protein ACJX0J_032215, partial [Zea mays]
NNIIITNLFFYIDSLQGTLGQISYFAQELYNQSRSLYYFIWSTLTRAHERQCHSLPVQIENTYSQTTNIRERMQSWHIDISRMTGTSLMFTNWKSNHDILIFQE